MFSSWYCSSFCLLSRMFLYDSLFFAVFRKYYGYLFPYFWLIFMFSFWYCSSFYLISWMFLYITLFLTVLKVLWLFLFIFFYFRLIFMFVFFWYCYDWFLECFFISPYFSLCFQKYYGYSFFSWYLCFLSDIIHLHVWFLTTSTITIRLCTSTAALLLSSTLQHTLTHPHNHYTSLHFITHILSSPYALMPLFNHY